MAYQNKRAGEAISKQSSGIALAILAHAPQQKASLFDDLIGNSEHLGRDVEA